MSRMIPSFQSCPFTEMGNREEAQVCTEGIGFRFGA